jgi:formamidopyrimidine-DNA glycosylase
VPELPDVTVYVERLQALTAGATLERVRLARPFLLRTVEPPLTAAHGRRIAGVRRLGKRVVLALDGGLFLVVHLMIAGRLHWKPLGAPMHKLIQAAFDFGGPEPGTLTLTEAGSKRRASLHVVAGEAGLAALDRGGLEVAGSGRADFAAALLRGNHTLKRALTDPSLFSGIGNAYSDEILHRARLSPFRRGEQLDAHELAALHAAAVTVLEEWTERLRAEAAAAARKGVLLPEKVTAFRKAMAVHGRYGQPCPACGAPVQRVIYAENEANYCAGCQTGGRLLADRVLSRLMKDDWPATLDELEELQARKRGAPHAS